MNRKSLTTKASKAGGSLLAIAVLTSLSLQLAQPAQADPTTNSKSKSQYVAVKVLPRTDYFNQQDEGSSALNGGAAKTPNYRKDMSAGAPGAGAMNSEDNAVTRWFEAFDATRFQHKPSAKDKNILTRPINQEWERLQQWTASAKAVSAEYKEFASIARKQPVPPGCSDLKDFIDLTADWYDDVGNVYADFVRPRHPCKTIEELSDQLRGVKNRQDELAKELRNLRAMENSLRDKYRVHAPFEDDALSIYVGWKNNSQGWKASSK